MLVIEVVSAVLGSLGGAALIVAAFANFLGKVWTERITAQVHAKHEQELEGVKAKHTLALEQFSRRAEAELKDAEIFSGISQEVYQGLFKKRIATYTKLMELKNKYVEDMHEDFLTEETERWGDVYVSSYKALRKVIVENQLYISTDLDKFFQDLRMKAAQYIREADIIEAYGMGSNEQPDTIMERQETVHQKLATETHDLMSKVLDQIGADVVKLRSRIDLDRV